MSSAGSLSASATAIIYDSSGSIRSMYNYTTHSKVLEGACQVPRRRRLGLECATCDSVEGHHVKISGWDKDKQRIAMSCQLLALPTNLTGPDKPATTKLQAPYRPAHNPPGELVPTDPALTKRSESEHPAHHTHNPPIDATT